MDGHLATFRSRTYRYDERHASRMLRATLLSDGLLPGVFSATAIHLMRVEQWGVMFLDLLVLIFLCYFGRQEVRVVRARNQRDRGTLIWFEGGNISISIEGKLETGSMDIFRSVVLQKSRGATRSVLVDVGWPAPRRFEGLDDMEGFGCEFQRRLSSDKVTIAKWMHR